MSWVTAPVRVGLGVGVATMAASTFTTLGLGALAPDLRTSLHLTTFEIGLLPGLLFFGALTASVPAGRLTDRIGAGRALTVSQLGIITGIGIAVASSSRWPFLTGVAVAGLGYGAVNPATNVLSTSLVPRGRRALFLSIKQTGVTLGGLAAGAVLPRLAAVFGWRGAVGVAIAGLLIGACSIGWNGVYMALITDRASHASLGRATGRGLVAIYGGVAVVPPVLGVVKDVTDSWATVWIVATVAVLMAGATLALSPRRPV